VIIVAIGSNLPAAGFASSVETAEAALRRIAEDKEIDIGCRSRWYETEPVPPSDQPWFLNGAFEVRTDLPPAELLDRLHQVEAAFGRVRRERNEARPLDLDLIDYRGLRSKQAPCLPHPRAHERAFVLYPLRDVCPDWRHPESGRSVASLIAALPADGSGIRPLGMTGAEIS